MNSSKFGTSAVAVLSCLMLAACGGGSTSDDPSSGATDPTPTDGSQTKAQLAGTYSSCALMSGGGSAITGKAFTRSLTLNANGTYTLGTDLTEATACAFGHPSGTGSGSVSFQVNASGTWSVGGTNTTPSTSTKITFVQTAQTLTLYSPSSTAGASATALAVANWANGCSSWGGSFSTSATSHSDTFFPLSCSATASVSLSAPPALNTSGYNIGYKSASLQTGSIIDVFTVNAGSFPSSYSVTWY